MWYRMWCCFCPSSCSLKGAKYTELTDIIESEKMYYRLAGLLTTLWHITLQASVNDCCTEGFFTVNELMSTTGALSAPNGPLRGVHPTLRATCMGTLTELFYVATSEGEFNQEYFDIWRRVIPGRDIYRISSIVSRASEVKVAMLDQDLALYSVKVNYSVVPGDFIGFTAFQFSTLKFVDLGNEVQTLFFTTTSTQVSLESVDILERRYDPLIAAAVSPSTPCSGTASTKIVVTKPVPVSSHPLISPTESASFTYLTIPTSSIAIHPTPVVTPDFVVIAKKTEVPTKGILSVRVTVIVAILASIIGVFCIGYCLVAFGILMGYALHKRKSRNSDDLSSHTVVAPNVNPSLDAVHPKPERNLYTQINPESKASDGDDSSMISNPLYNEHVGEQRSSVCSEGGDKNTDYETLNFEKLPTGDDNNYNTLQHLDHVTLDYPGSAEYSQFNGRTSPVYINNEVLQAHGNMDSVYHQISKEGEDDIIRNNSGSVKYEYCEIPVQFHGDNDTYIETNGAYFNS